MERKEKIHILKAEAYRIFGSPLFWIAVISGAAMKFMECYSDPDFGIRAYMDTPDSQSVPYFLEFSEGNYLIYVVVCLSTLPAVLFYAEEFQKNALTMRIQRMGAGRYVLSRMTLAAGSAFLCMLLIDLLTAFIIVVPCGQDLVPSSSWTLSNLLEQEQYVLYLVIMIWRNCLEASFYAALTVGISVFLPNRQALVVVPVILNYAFNYVAVAFSESRFIAFLPREIYAQVGTSSYTLGVSEPVMAVIMLLYTIAAVLICGGLLCLRVRDRLHVYAPSFIKDKGAGLESQGRQKTEKRNQPDGLENFKAEGSTDRANDATAADMKRQGSGRIIRSLRSVASVTRYELYMVFFSAKFWVLILVAVIFMHSFIGEITRFASDYGLTLPPAAVCFYYSDNTYCNMGFMIFIFLISDAPFRENNQVYLLERSGRRGLCIGQLVSLCIISVIFTAIQFVISVLMSLPHISTSGWGKVWGSIADGLTGDLGYNITAQVSQNIISAYTPWQAIIISFVLISLMGMCYGMIAYLLNNIGSGKLGTIALSVWSLGWLFLSNMAGNLVIRKLLQLSTQRWLNLDYLDWEELPGHILAICVVILVLAVVNVLVDRRKLR